MAFLEKEDIKIHYTTWDAGTGPWVTLVNGYTRTLTDFRAMARYLSERGFRVITFDNRGAGKAECPPAFTIEDIGLDILSLWDHLKVEKSHLLGISYGGAIVATFASNYPQKVDKLILVSTPASVDFLSVEVDAPSRDTRKFIMQQARYFSKGFLEKNKPLIDGFMRQNLKILQEPDTALGASAQRDSMAELDLTEKLSNISAATFIVHGQEDRIVNVESAVLLSKKILKSKLELIPDVSHLLLVECPQKLYEMVHEFLKGS